MVSKDSEDLMATGTARALASNFSMLTDPSWGADMAVGLEKLVVPTASEDGGADILTVYTVSKVTLGEPEDGATIYSSTGESFLVSSSGDITMVEPVAATDALAPAAAARRRLLAVGNVGSGAGPVTMVMSQTGQQAVSSLGDATPVDCSKWKQTVQDEWMKQANKKGKKKKGKKGSASSMFTYPNGMPLKCKMEMIFRSGSDGVGDGRQ